MGGLKRALRILDCARLAQHRNDMNVVVGKRRDDVAHERDQMQRLPLLPGQQITPCGNASRRESNEAGLFVASGCKCAACLACLIGYIARTSSYRNAT
jgi:hypothetical protein